MRPNYLTKNFHLHPTGKASAAPRQGPGDIRKVAKIEPSPSGHRHDGEESERRGGRIFPPDRSPIVRRPRLEGERGKGQGKKKKKKSKDVKRRQRGPGTPGGEIEAGGKDAAEREGQGEGQSKGGSGPQFGPVVRRPATRAQETQWEAGQEVALHMVPPLCLLPGTPLVVTRGGYYGAEAMLAATPGGVCGGLVYFSMFRRPLLGCLNSVWQLIESFNQDGKGLKPFPLHCKAEILKLVSLVSLARLDFRLPFHEQVTCSDASSSGGGVCASAGLSHWGSLAAP